MIEKVTFRSAYRRINNTGTILHHAKIVSAIFKLDKKQGQSGHLHKGTQRIH